MFKSLAANPLKTKGRLYNEYDEDLFRTPFERDRDRIIHSNSFRKLKHKTQVFIETESDYFRTRLTHSLEVAQISRSLCRLFDLNEDLGETVALAHDLGHPPFGHNGEKSLNDVMMDFGKFNHNDQTLRLITFIEKRHPNFNGLNLSWESLEGIVKHNGILSNNIHFHLNSYNKSHDLNLKKQPHLESQIASISDDIAYNNHDIEDAIRAKLIHIDQLKEIDFYKVIISEINDKYKVINSNQLMYQMIRKSISKMIMDVYDNTKKIIYKSNLKTLNNIKDQQMFTVSMSEDMNKKCFTIKKFLYDNLYNHKSLLLKRSNSEKIITKLFNYFINNSNKLPNDWKINNKIEIERNVCDYISGMTDRYASRLYSSIYE